MTWGQLYPKTHQWTGGLEKKKKNGSAHAFTHDSALQTHRVLSTTENDREMPFQIHLHIRTQVQEDDLFSTSEKPENFTVSLTTLQRSL